MIWANIPPEAVMHYMSLGELVELSDNDTACANILHLEHFDPYCYTTAVASLLQGEKLILDVTTAHAMARIAKTFNVHSNAFKLCHVQDFIARLVDGFKIKDMSGDITAAAFAFATSLGPSGHSFWDIMKAFGDGVEAGTQTMDYFASCSRTV